MCNGMHDAETTALSTETVNELPDSYRNDKNTALQRQQAYIYSIPMAQQFTVPNSVLYHEIAVCSIHLSGNNDVCPCLLNLADWLPLSL